MLSIISIEHMIL